MVARHRTGKRYFGTQFVAELLNTGIEAAVNRHGDERHHWSGVAKDVASAAVLLALLQCLLVWSLVLFF